VSDAAAFDIGQSLASKLQAAVRQHAKHTTILAHFTAKFSSELVEEWESMIREWDKNPSKLNPYDEPVLGRFMPFLM
jgi:hypothetical protein